MKIGEREMPIALGMNTWIDFCELRGITITEMGETLDAITNGGGTGSEIRDIAWAALKNGARKAKLSFEMDNYDVGDLIDDMDSDEIAKFFREIGDSMASKLPSENGGAKKKQAAS